MSALAERLGIKRGARVGFVNAPASFVEAVMPLPSDVRVLERASEPLDVIVYFSDTRANIARRVPLLVNYLAPGATLWLGYPRRGSAISSDVAREDVTAIAREAGLAGAEDVDMDPEWALLGVHLATRPAAS